MCLVAPFYVLHELLVAIFSDVGNCFKAGSRQSPLCTLRSEFHSYFTSFEDVYVSFVCYGLKELPNIMSLIFTFFY